MDLAVRRLRADPEVIVGLDDAIEPRDVSQVDEEPGLGEAELEQRDEAVAAGEQLRFALALGQYLERLVEISGTHVVELSRNHRAIVLLTHWPGIGALEERACTAVTIGPTAGPGRVAWVRPEVRRVRYEYARALVSTSTSLEDGRGRRDRRSRGPDLQVGVPRSMKRIKM